MTADRWTHHDPAVRQLIRRAQADAWDEGFMRAVGPDHPGQSRLQRYLNPYRDEVTR